MTLCECGCGQEVKPGNRFINYHQNRGKNNSMYGKERTLSPEHCAAISKTHTGISFSLERCAAIKKGLEDSGIFEKMRGGNDIVNHHYIYDHSDLSLNTVEMTRSDHMRLHHLLRKLGYIVPHINLPDEPTR